MKAANKLMEKWQGSAEPAAGCEGNVDITICLRRHIDNDVFT
jgi:hypothetical protein